MARPTLLTDDLQAAIVADLEAGNYLSTAAEANGISYRSALRWIKRGRAERKTIPETPYASFWRSVKKARRIGEKDLVARVREGKPGWQGAAWILERTRRKKYGRMVQESRAADEKPNNIADLIASEIEAEKRAASPT